MTQDGQGAVRVRFAPSPTGYLHIGGARTVLFNWLVARQALGTLVLRIEDTDRTRHVEDSIAKILNDLRWLGLDWDEGPEADGDYGPYFQSERLDRYNHHIEKLLSAGHAYYALETPQELQRMREAAEARTGGFQYPRPDPLPTIEQGQTARAAGKSAVVRFKMPSHDLTVVDEVLGEVTLKAEHFEDFVIQKSDGFPTYHFACVVDDALMEITHVLRGQEHLMNTPKHVALQRALGFVTPHYAHMPVIINMDGSKMSKRDKEKAVKAGLAPPEIDVHDFRAAGYLPEAVVNFIALLGWSTGDDREYFDTSEMVARFRIDRIGKTNARFDREKLLSFNTEWATRVSAKRLLGAFKDYIAVNQKVLPPGWREADDARLAEVLRVCAGFRTFPDVVKKAGFLFVEDDAVEYDSKALKKVLGKNDREGFRMLETLAPLLRNLADWGPDSLQRFFEDLCKEHDVKLGKVAQPIRVAVSGTTISPSIHDTLHMLGRERTLARIDRCLSIRD
ncbi:MAG: glutamate--tRNA ligase [Phycisphaerae bacterium]|jgi:glutamyl-tRNA synthetase